MMLTYVARRTKVAIVITVLFLLYGVIVSINYQSGRKFRLWTLKMEQARSKVLQDLQRTPYQGDQQSNFRIYFSELHEKVEDLASDQSLQKRFNRFLDRDGMESLCSKVLIPRANWEVVVRNCSRNGFFLCAPVVNDYNMLVQSFRKSLEPDLQRRFDDSETCRTAL